MKALNMVSRKNIWKGMEDLGVASEYMLAIFWIYEKVICYLHMGDRISKNLNWIIVVKQGYPTFTNSKFEQMVAKFVNE